MQRAAPWTACSRRSTEPDYVVQDRFGTGVEDNRGLRPSSERSQSSRLESNSNRLHLSSRSIKFLKTNSSKRSERGRAGRGGEQACQRTAPRRISVARLPSSFSQRHCVQSCGAFCGIPELIAHRLIDSISLIRIDSSVMADLGYQKMMEARRGARSGTCRRSGVHQ